MDSARFDAMARSWTHGSRRAGLRWLTGGALTVALARFSRTDTEAKKNKNKNKAKKKPKKKDKKPGDPYVDCGDGFYTCTSRYENGIGINICCPDELQKCCPSGCCQAGNPYLICGPDANTPCLLDISLDRKGRSRWPTRTRLTDARRQEPEEGPDRSWKVSGAMDATQFDTIARILHKRGWTRGCCSACRQWLTPRRSRRGRRKRRKVARIRPRHCLQHHRCGAGWACQNSHCCLELGGNCALNGNECCAGLQCVNTGTVFAPVMVCA